VNEFVPWLTKGDVSKIATISPTMKRRKAAMIRTFNPLTKVK
jgi:hypothetical protein